MEMRSFNTPYEPIAVELGHSPLACRLHYHHLINKARKMHAMNSPMYPMSGPSYAGPSNYQTSASWSEGMQSQYHQPPAHSYPLRPRSYPNGASSYSNVSGPQRDGAERPTTNHRRLLPAQPNHQQQHQHHSNLPHVNTNTAASPFRSYDSQVGTQNGPSPNSAVSPRQVPNADRLMQAVQQHSDNYWPTVAAEAGMTPDEAQRYYQDFAHRQSIMNEQARSAGYAQQPSLQMPPAPQDHSTMPTAPAATLTPHQMPRVQQTSTDSVHQPSANSFQGPSSNDRMDVLCAAAEQAAPQPATMTTHRPTSSMQSAEEPSADTEDYVAQPRQVIALPPMQTNEGGTNSNQEKPEERRDTTSRLHSIAFMLDPPINPSS